jgi:hypothetical protein
MPAAPVISGAGAGARGKGWVGAFFFLLCQGIIINWSGYTNFNLDQNLSNITFGNDELAL